MADAYRALASIGTRLHGGDGDIDDAFGLVVASASQLLATEVAWLSLTDDSGAVLRPKVLRAFRDPNFTEVTIPVAAGLGGRALRERRTIVVGNYSTYTDPENPDRVWDALRAEGLVSVMCSPMILRHKLVGALYVASRTTTTFGPTRVALLEALASQATVAIENRRLYRGLGEQNGRLEQSLTVHRRLTRASADGVGIGGIAGILGDLLSAALRVEASVPGVEAVEIGDPDPSTATTYPIRAGSDVVGALTVYDSDSATSYRVQAIEHGLTVLALELVKLRSQWDVEERMSADLLGDMLEHSTPLPVGIRRRAARFGVDTAEDCRVVVIGVREQGSVDAALTASATLAREGIRGVLYTGRSGTLVVAVPSSRDEVVDRIVSIVDADLGAAGLRCVVGIGPLSSVRDSYAAANACLSLALKGGYRSPRRSVDAVAYDELGPLRFLLDANDITHAERMVLSRLNPLIEDDKGRSTKLVPTLREFVGADGHYERTAAALFIGTTTLKYRLNKISERFGIDAKNADTRFELRLAFELLALIETRSP